MPGTTLGTRNTVESRKEVQFLPSWSLQFNRELTLTKPIPDASQNMCTWNKSFNSHKHLYKVAYWTFVIHVGHSASKTPSYGWGSLHAWGGAQLPCLRLSMPAFLAVKPGHVTRPGQSAWPSHTCYWSNNCTNPTWQSGPHLTSQRHQQAFVGAGSLVHCWWSQCLLSVVGG